MTPPTLHQLRQAEEGFRLVANEAETLRERRNALIREALASGLTHAQVADATGLTRGRIGQIATKDLVVHHINGDPTDNNIENLRLQDRGR